MNLTQKIAMKKFLILFLICAGLPGCMNFPTKVGHYVSKKYGDADSTSVYEIDLQDVLGVKISDVYVFGEVTSNEEISEIIGIELPHRRMTWSWETKYRIICVYDKQVTYEELYTRSNVFINGNDTIWHFSPQCIDRYSQFHPGMTAATWCKYKVFHSPKMKIKREPFDKDERYEYWYIMPKYWYELSAAE